MCGALAWLHAEQCHGTAAVASHCKISLGAPPCLDLSLPMEKSIRIKGDRQKARKGCGRGGEDENRGRVRIGADINKCQK